MKGKIQLFIAFLFVVSLNITASTNDLAITPPWLPTGDVKVMVYDHYLSFRTGSAVTRTPVIWGQIESSLPLGLYFQTFGSYSVASGPGQRMGNQVDFVLGKRLGLEDLYKVKFDFNVRYSNISPMGDWSKADLGYINLIISRDFALGTNHVIRPHVYTEWLGRLNSFEEGALLEQVGFTHIWKRPFGIARLSLVSCNVFSWIDRWGTLPPGFFFRSDVSFNWRVAKNLDLFLPACRLIAGDDTRKNDWSWMAGLKLSF